MNKIHIRLACPEDAENLLAVYAPYVEHTAITFEYVVPTVEEFRQRISHTLERFPYLAAEADGKIVGYAYASPFKTRAAYDWAVETSIYVDQAEKGRGIGKMLYQNLEELLKKQHIINVNACITYPNSDSIAFHEALGYKTVAHFTKCGYKLGQWHDMIWMEKMVSPHPEQPKRVIPFSELISCSELHGELFVL